MLQDKLAISVSEAGKLLGIGRASAFRAAKRGDLPIVQIGKRKLVSVAGLKRMMDNAGNETHNCNCYRPVRVDSDFGGNN